MNTLAFTYGFVCSDPDMEDIVENPLWSAGIRSMYGGAACIGTRIACSIMPEKFHWVLSAFIGTATIYQFSNAMYHRAEYIKKRKRLNYLLDKE